MKKRTRKQIYNDYAEAIKAMKAGILVKRHSAKDGSIPTHPVIDVPDLPENEVLKECMKWLKQHHIFCNRNNTGAGCMGESGFYSYGIKNGGDIIGMLSNGQHFEIEVKKGSGGRLSEGQQKRMRDVRNNNGIYLVIHGVIELENYFRELI